MRQRLLQQLERYRTLPGTDPDLSARFIEFVANNPRCTDREFPPGHVTASAWLVSHDLRLAFMVQHRKLGLWLQPGGHIEADKDLLSASVREASEESGLLNISPLSEEIFDLDIHPIPARPESSAHFHYDVRYLLRACSDSSGVASSESTAVGWFKPEEIVSLKPDNSVLRLVAKWTAGTWFAKA